MKIDIFEVCAGSVQDCINAELGGADRVELNSALYLGAYAKFSYVKASERKDFA